MIIVAEELEKRLDTVWNRLQSMLHKDPMSQYGLDESAIRELERIVSSRERLAHEIKEARIALDSRQIHIAKEKVNNIKKILFP
jgi:hypothetical protein